MKKKKLLSNLVWILIFVLILYGINSYRKINLTQFNSANQNIVIKNSKNIAAPNFTLTTIDGKTISLIDLKGKNVYINFWATWCPPCKLEMPEIEKLYKDAKDSDLVILAVNLGEDNKTVTNFMKNKNYHFITLLDSKQAVADLYNVTSIPTSYFIDKNGNLVSGIKGPLFLPQMKLYIHQLNK